MKKKSKFKRVSRNYVSTNARDQASSGKMDWISPPRGVAVWYPEQPLRIKMDILPYVVSTSTHPDRVESDRLWYKFPFAVHRNVGVDSRSLVCPISVDSNSRCPICANRRDLLADYDSNVDVIKDLSAQKWALYNMVDPEDPKKVVVFAMSRGKFAALLESELLEGDEGNLAFYDVTSEGRTLEVRFKKSTFKNTDYIEADRIDFTPRDEMDEDEVLGRVVCLEKCLTVLSESEISRIFSSSAEGDVGEDADKKDTEVSPRERPRTRDPDPDDVSEDIPGWDHAPDPEDQDEEDFSDGDDSELFDS